jgi:hypothetical protein
MSHFSVFVIGDNVEAQLAPYHEFECTGVNDQYVQDVDVTADVQDKGLDYYGLDEKTVTSMGEVDTEGEHKFGYALVDARGNVLKAVNRTNPNRKWDWYQLGGRWSGFLKAKPGRVDIKGTPGLMGSQASDAKGQFDVLRKGEIDFAGMRDEAAQEAAAKWDKAYAARGGKDWITWDHVRDVLHKDDIEAARKAYNEQPALVQLKAHEDFKFSWAYDKFLTPRDKYVQQARDSAASPFAVVMDSKWYERGEMGWWGMVSNEQDMDAWNAQVNTLLGSLPDDTTITVVDCHI